MKSPTREDKVAEFHKAMGLAVNYEAHSSLLELRSKLIMEEAYEVEGAINEMLINLNYGKDIEHGQWAHLLKELCDLQYVLSGTVVALRRLNAVDFDVAFNRVHESNMSKFDEDGVPIKDSRGKVLKGPNYKAPNLEDCV
jgi:predicted HAD superfamily Cof-like phosphohydrolase